MNKIRYLSLLMLLASSVIMLGKASPYVRLLADKTQLTVVADPPEGGTVSGGGSYEAGESVKLTAKAATGFKFVNWTRNGIEVSTESSFSYTKTNVDETLTAHFVFSPSNPAEPDEPDIKKKYVLNLLTEEGGSNVKGAGTYDEGTKVTVSVSVNTGFVFQGWYNSAGNMESDKMSFSYTVTGNETLTARFVFSPSNPDDPPQPDTTPYYVLTLLTEEGGYNVKGAGTYKEGTSVQVSVQSETGYTFLGWYDSQGEQVSDKNSFKYELNGHETLTARFAFNPDNPDDPPLPDVRPSYVLTLQTEEGGYNVKGAGTYKEGTSVQVSVQSETGYTFLGWYDSQGEQVSDKNSFKYEVNGHETLTARFRYNPGNPIEPSMSDDHRISLYVTSVKGLPGQTVDIPVYLSCQDSIADIQFQITFPAGLTIQTENVRLSGKAQDYSLSVTQTANGAAGAPHRAGTDSSYLFSITGGKLPPCNTRLVVLKVDVADDFTEESNLIVINDVMINNIDGTTTTASTQNGKMVLQTSSEEGTYYYLTLISTGNGQALVNSIAVRNSMHTFDFLEGTSANVYFTPDDGYFLANVMLEDEDVTDQVTDGNRYLLENMNKNVTMTVMFEQKEIVIPKVADVEFAQNGYLLTLSTPTEGATIHYTLSNSEAGEQVYTDVLTMTGDCIIEAWATKNSYTTSDVTRFEFHADGVTCSVPQIVRNGNKIGISTTTEQAIIYYTMDGSTPTAQSAIYTDSIVVERNCTIKAIAMRDNYYSSQVATFVVGWFNVSNVSFLQNMYKLTLTTATEDAQIWYKVTPGNDEYVRYTGMLTFNDDCIVEAYAARDGYNNSDTTRYEFFIPVAEYVFDGTTLHVKSVGHMQSILQLTGADASKTIAAIIWDSDNQLTNSMMQDIENPNLLLYVSNKSLAPGNVKNVVVGDSINGYKAQQIVLKDTESGNGNFFCPIPFTANRISYERDFRQQTEMGICRGWETIALPFAVQSIMHERNGVLTPFAGSGNGRPFWLREMTGNGFMDAAQIEAYKPYIISMPNEPGRFDAEYQLGGRVTFSGYSCLVPKTNQQRAVWQAIRFIPALSSVAQSDSVYVLNVGEEYAVGATIYEEGSIFVAGLSDVRPFRCYTKHDANSPAPRYLPLNGWLDDATGIGTTLIDNGELIMENGVYNLNGQRVMNPTKGLYIVNGKKVVKKH